MFFLPKRRTYSPLDSPLPSKPQFKTNLPPPRPGLALVKANGGQAERRRLFKELGTVVVICALCKGVCGIFLVYCVYFRVLRPKKVTFVHSGCLNYEKERMVALRFCPIAASSFQCDKSTAPEL